MFPSGSSSCKNSYRANYSSCLNTYCYCWLELTKLVAGYGCVWNESVEAYWIWVGLWPLVSPSCEHLLAIPQWDIYHRLNCFCVVNWRRMVGVGMANRRSGCVGSSLPVHTTHRAGSCYCTQLCHIAENNWGSLTLTPPRVVAGRNVHIIHCTPYVMTRTITVRKFWGSMWHDRMQHCNFICR